MQLGVRQFSVTNSTLTTLLVELGAECQNVIALLNQMQLPNQLSYTQQAKILAELLAAAIHLQTHCGEDFQALIADAMEKLPDDDEED